MFEFEFILALLHIPEHYGHSYEKYGEFTKDICGIQSKKGIEMYRELWNNLCRSIGKRRDGVIFILWNTNGTNGIKNVCEWKVRQI